MKFGKRNMVLMGIGIGLSSAFPPNTFRMLAIDLILFALATSIVMVSKKSVFHIKQMLRKIMPSILVSVIVMLYWIIPFATNLELNIQTLTSAYAGRSYGQSSTITPYYATLLQVLRLTGAWQFSNGVRTLSQLIF